MTPPEGRRPAFAGPSRRVLRAAIWLPGLAVALGAAVATAHGLYEVAVAARVPAGIAWLYPLITDGLALVAYAATARLHGHARRYAWAIVVLAAGLSGLAQASLLAGHAAPLAAPAALRFGVGAWPAVAAAIVAHLLYLLASHEAGERDHERAQRTSSAAVPALPATFADAAGPLRPGLSDRPAVRPDSVAGNGDEASPTAPNPGCPSDAPESDRTPSGTPSTWAGHGVSDPARRPMDSPARDRAQTAATRHAARHGDLPTVRQLMALAHVGRGTAADALRTLREHGTPLHLVPDNPESRTQR